MVRSATVRIILHIVTIMQWEVKKMDIKNDFLHVDLIETVFLRQPAGFVDKARPNHVCHLHKSLYGLKESPRAWLDKFSNFFLEFGFICSIPDPSLFVYIKGKYMILLLLYVDDMAKTGSDSEAMKCMMKELNKQFIMKDMGRFSYFLGIQAQFHEEGIFLSQQIYAEDIITVATMDNCTSMPTHFPLQLHKVPDQEELFQNPTYFRSLACKVQYLTLTKVDIQFDVNYVCQKMHAPTMSYYKLLKRIIWYVKGTVTIRITFSKDTYCTLSTYSDSDFAGCKITRRSTGGLCTYLGNNLISWSSKEQSTVSKSST